MILIYQKKKTKSKINTVRDWQPCFHHKLGCNLETKTEIEIIWEN